MSYINFPIAVDYEDVYTDAITYLQDKFAGWQANDGNLDTAILQAWATEAAQLRELASSVTMTIFRWFGASMVNLPPIDAQPATTLTDWTVQDNLGYTIPANTQVIITQDGVDYGFETLVDVVIPPGSTTAIGVTIVALIAGADASGIGSIGGAVQLYDSLAFVTNITMETPTSGGVDAEDDATYLSRLREELTLLSPRLILPKDFAIDAKQIAGVWRAIAIDGYNPFHNLLSANDASFETSVAGWGANLNVTIAQTAAQAADGTHSMQMTATAAGDMNARLGGTGDEVAVIPGDVVTAIAAFRAATTPKACKVGIIFYTSGNVAIGSATYGATVNDTTTDWSCVPSVTAVAPATAAFARVIVYVVAAAASGVHYVDKVSIRRGTGTDWVPGGTAETGQPRTISESAVDSDGNPIDAGTKAELLARQQALREVNFLLYLIDPTVTAFDVTCTVVGEDGFDKTQLQLDVENAIASFLNKATWGTDQTVQGDAQSRTWSSTFTSVLRFIDLATIVRNVQGLAYVSLLQVAISGQTLGQSDIQLPGPAPLATAGTIIVAVS